jgi:dihydrofolate reductase
MGKIVFGMMQSLDGYVAGTASAIDRFVAAAAGDVDAYDAELADAPDLPPPGPALGRHFLDRVRCGAGSLLGRRMYGVMRYWDEDRPEWDESDHEFAAVWRGQPKWVASRTLKSVGPNATLITDDLEAFVRKLKSDIHGEIDVAGPALAAALTDLDLIDEYHLYYRPFVLGGGKPFFASPCRPLRHVATNQVGEDAVQIILVPA